MPRADFINIATTFKQHLLQVSISAFLLYQGLPNCFKMMVIILFVFFLFLRFVTQNNKKILLNILFIDF